MCHMTPQVSDFIPGLLEDMDKYVDVVDGHYFTAKQKGQVQIRICDDNRYSVIKPFHTVIFAPDLCNRLFLISTLKNSGHTCLFHKGFCML